MYKRQAVVDSAVAPALVQRRGEAAEAAGGEGGPKVIDLISDSDGE